MKLELHDGGMGPRHGSVSSMGGTETYSGGASLERGSASGGSSPNENAVSKETGEAAEADEEDVSPNKTEELVAED